MATWKDTCRVASTANITLSGLQTIDGVALAAGNRVLVKNQTTAKDNGIYTVVTPGAWTRTADANTGALLSGMLVPIGSEGTAQGNTAWACTTTGTITVGTTALSFAAVAVGPWNWACRAATTVTGGNITLSGLQTVDGVSLASGDRVLVKNQTTAANNGLYLASAGTWTRAVDFGITQALPEFTVAVSEGTVNAHSSWALSTQGSITLGTTSLSFTARDLTFQGVACRAATTVTTGNIALSGLQTIDGVSLAGGDRVLVKNQTTGANNGIYLVSAGSWARSLDFDAAKSLRELSVAVSEGTVNAHTSWTLSTQGSITVGTTSLAFSPRDQTFQKVTDLRSVNSAESTTIQAVGYSTPGDGGGGQFCWDAASTVADDTGITLQPNAVAINGATNASPIVIATASAHGFTTGQQIGIQGVGGNTAANGSWVITSVDSTHFSLNGSTGNAAYTTGGYAAGAGRWRRIYSGALHAAWFGIKGDGSDEFTTIQALITLAQTRGEAIVFQSNHTYGISAPLVITAPIEIRADNGNVLGTAVTYAMFKAIPAFAWSPTHPGMRCCFDVSAAINARGIYCDGNRKAHYGWFMQYASFSHLQQCAGVNCLSDGFHQPRYRDEVGLPFALSDTVHYEDCYGLSNGTVYCPSNLVGIPYTQLDVGGTVTATNGSAVLQFSGGVDFSSMGNFLRYGDSICVINSGAFPTTDAQFFQIADGGVNVGAEQITCTAVATSTMTSKIFFIGHGCGLFFVHFANNNICKISRGLWRFNAAMGIQGSGSVGHVYEGPQVDFNAFYGIGIGPGGAGTTYTSVLNQPYLEGNLVAHLMFNSAQGIAVNGPQFSPGVLYDVLELVTTNSGAIIGHVNSSLAPIGISPIGTCENRIPTTAGLRFRNVGTYGRSIGGSSSFAVNTTIAYDCSVIYLQAITGTYISTPTLANGVTSGDECELFSQGTITLQDNAVLAGTNLALKTPTVLLRPGDSLKLRWDGPTTMWSEKSRTLRTPVADGTATPGNVTQEAYSGRVAVAIGAATVAITNHMVTTASKVFAQLQFNDATATTIKYVVCTANTITITMNANATLATAIAWRLEE